jgi:hypothetical protein
MTSPDSPYSPFKRINLDWTSASPDLLGSTTSPSVNYPVEPFDLSSSRNVSPPVTGHRTPAGPMNSLPSGPSATSFQTQSNVRRGPQLVINTAVSRTQETNLEPRTPFTSFRQLDTPTREAKPPFSPIKQFTRLFKRKNSPGSSATIDDRDEIYQADRRVSPSFAQQVLQGSVGARLGRDYE